MSKDIVQRAVSLLEREGFIKEAEAIEALEAEVINHRSIMDHAVKRAEAAEAEVERLKGLMEYDQQSITDLRAYIRQSDAQASRMRDALTFYAAEDTWRSCIEMGVDERGREIEQWGPPAIDQDGGTIARKALEQ